VHDETLNNFILFCLVLDFVTIILCL